MLKIGLSQLINSFTLGLLTPLTAACVLPLYPGFISYLSSRMTGEESRRTYAMFGTLVVAGVISFMLSIGLVFSALLQVSLTGVIATVSPIAFTVLLLISLVMLLDIDFQSRLPNYSGPRTENPLLDAFGFGFFFGAIVIPCNPGFIAIFLARASLFQTPVSSLSNFLVFGLGIGFPLLAFSLVSANRGQQIIQKIQKHESIINRATGFLMLAISLYYLTCVFGIGGAPGEAICGVFKQLKLLPVL
ncbi:MAG: cytochrome c biogenesis protein CcdA [Candidatus Nanohaloarchaea archaeon]